MASPQPCSGLRAEYARTGNQNVRESEALDVIRREQRLVGCSPYGPRELLTKTPVDLREASVHPLAVLRASEVAAIAWESSRAVACRHFFALIGDLLG
jgi:hypothetical protein